MSGEKMLLNLISGALVGIECNIRYLVDLPSEDGIKIPGFDDGKICGLSSAKGAIEACLRLYDTYKKGEMPQEMIDRLLQEADEKYASSTEEVKLFIEMLKMRGLRDRENLPPKQ